MKLSMDLKVGVKNSKTGVEATHYSNSFFEVDVKDPKDLFFICEDDELIKYCFKVSDILKVSEILTEVLKLRKDD